MPWEMYDGEEETVQQPSGCIMDAILEDHEWIAKTYLKNKKSKVLKQCLSHNPESQS